MELDPGGIIAWLIVGAVAGWLAGLMMQGMGFGFLGNIVVGIIGAFVGGFVLSLLGVMGQVGLFGSIFVAFIGAAIFLAVVFALMPRRRTL